MQRLADYILEIHADQFSVSAPMLGDSSQPSQSIGGANGRRWLTFGLSAEGARRIGPFVGREGRLMTNMHNPGVELGRLRILKVAESSALLTAEIVPPAPPEAGGSAALEEEQAEVSAKRSGLGGTPATGRPLEPAMIA